MKSYVHEGVLAFGCNCNKNKAAAVARTTRQTIYQVIKNGGIISEFSTLPEARSEAIAQQGQVRVSSKTVN